MGSLIALEAAYLRPAAVRALALVGSTWPMKVSDALLETARTDEAAAIDMVNLWSHASIAPAAAGSPQGFWAPGASRRLMQRMSAINPDQLFYTDFNACNAYANGEAAAASVRCPVLFVLGKKDMMTPARSAKALCEAIPQSKSVQIDAGHQMMAEKPDAVLDALFAFASAIERN
jgi:pimeloyl-ACP methyl ester carboxylesterase